MGLDFYDISLADGFGVPLRMTPIDGTFEKNHADDRSCKSIACQADLIAGCPEELKLRQDDRVVACQSACTKFHSEEYCCTGRSVCSNGRYPCWLVPVNLGHQKLKYEFPLVKDTKARLATTLARVL
jgi:hypothetical protein